MKKELLAFLMFAFLGGALAALGYGAVTWQWWAVFLPMLLLFNIYVFLLEQETNK